MEITQNNSNLEELISEFRNKGRALKGYKNIKSCLLYQKDEDLEHLLRDHKKESIKTDEEVEFRDTVDFLIKFYSIIEIAILSGFVSPALNVKLILEINEVLGNEAVKKYYINYYPLLLPQVLLKEINTLKKGKKFINDKRLSLFNQFLLTIKSIDHDFDVEQFQWFLDSGSTEDEDMSDFLEIFNSEKKVIANVKRKTKNKILNKAFWGYIKYINFLTDYKILLDQSINEPLLQSAFWHYQSYWFIQIKTKMSNALIPSLNKLNKIVDEVDQSTLLDSENDIIKLRYETEEFDYAEWKEESSNIVNKAIADIKLLLDEENYAQPLREYLNSSKPKL